VEDEDLARVLDLAAAARMARQSDCWPPCRWMSAPR
jgi:hypothetical protein